MNIIVEYLSDLDDIEKTLTIDPSYYKLNFSYLEFTDIMAFTVKIMKSSADLRVVRLTKKEGTTIEFYNFFSKLLEDLPYLADGVLNDLN